MRKKLKIFFLFLTLFQFVCCVANTNISSDYKDNYSIILDNDGDEILFGDYIISNNVWGKNSLRDYSQCIFYNEKPLRFGWAWSWPSTMNKVHAYPEVIYGKKPWNTISTAIILPIKIADIVSSSVEYQINISAAGKYNTAFDIWLTNTIDAQVESIAYEIMIWIENSGMHPLGKHCDTVTLDDRDYDVYLAYDLEDGKWAYICLKTKETLLNGKIDIKEIIEYLLEADYITNDLYLASIEFGNEVMWGTGETTVSTYKVRINEN